MKMREKILALLSEGEKFAAELQELGSRSFVQGTLKELVDEGIVFKHGRAKATTYSLQAKPRFPAKKVQELVLPDLPPIMLQWGGYTDKVPDPMAGEVIHGGQWV